MSELADVLLEIENQINGQEQEKWKELKRFIRELRADKKELQRKVDDAYLRLVNEEASRAMKVLQSVSDVGYVETSVSEKEVRYLETGDYVRAIKEYRSRTGAGLKTAKDKIDRKKKELGL